jgi:hypothetical protein
VVVSVSRHMPRPAPPDTKPVWERVVPGVGRVFMNGVISRRGRPSYLLRVDVTGRNVSIICLIMADGSVGQWFFDWEKRSEELRPVVAEAGEFILAHHVLGS